MEIYCDNAATTILAAEVLEAMLPYLRNYYGNPSSNHRFGKQAKEAIIQSRQKIAGLLNTSPDEIFFTSGATEADNLALGGTIQSYQIRHVISSALEHPAVLKCLEYYQQKGQIQVSLLKNDKYGRLDYQQLEELLRQNPNTFISLMHGNNELGNLNDINEIARLSQKYQAIFHSDTVQTVGKYRFDLQRLKADFIVGSAHKFHGPKGIGFIYINRKLQINSLIYGGSQEKGIRSGTENVAGIVGLAKALEIAHENFEDNQKYLKNLKSHFINRLQNTIPHLAFNGESASAENSLANIINVSFPKIVGQISLLAYLENQGVAVSGGSACSHLSQHGSPVLRALGQNLDNENIRFSLSKYNTLAELDYIIEKLSHLYQQNQILKRELTFA